MAECGHMLTMRHALPTNMQSQQMARLPCGKSESFQQVRARNSHLSPPSHWASQALRKHCMAGKQNADSTELDSKTIVAFLMLSAREHPTKGRRGHHNVYTGSMIIQQKMGYQSGAAASKKIISAEQDPAIPKEWHGD